MTGGERLRQLREANDLPRRILAEWMNISQSILQRIEEGRREPYPYEIDAAVRVFRITPEEFYSGAALTHGMTSGERLRALRRASAWTLYDLAKRCGVHTVTVSAWEAGGASPVERTSCKARGRFRRKDGNDLRRPQMADGMIREN